MKYKVPCFWKVSGYHVIEAESLERAQEIVDDPDLWVGDYAHLDVLPQPSQEESRDDFQYFEVTEEASADEIATSETISDREALGLALGALCGMVAMYESVQPTGGWQGAHEDAQAAIEQAEKALAV